jgi:hypothetical protein
LTRIRRIRVFVHTGDGATGGYVCVIVIVVDDDDDDDDLNKF